MAKTQVYSWRLSARLKEDLEEEARLRKVSVGALMESISEDWLRHRSERGEDQEQRQERLRQAALAYAGSVHGGDPDRASQARQRVRQRLKDLRDG